MESKLETFLQTLQRSIITWDYFVDFKKCYENAFKLKIQLNILNSLLGGDRLEEKFLQIIDKYPETREALLILIATRKAKVSELPILCKSKLEPENLGHLFDIKVPLTETDKNKLWAFFIESGLLDIFQNKQISNLEDYVFGVEVGLDSNGRKNRTGVIMESLVEKIVRTYCVEMGFEYLPKPSKSSILKHFGRTLMWDELSSSRKGERTFDFAIFDHKKNHLVIGEVNYYGASGSKPNSIAREYIALNKVLKVNDIKFIWVTDGLGWEKMKNSLEIAIDNIDYVVNLTMLKNGRLHEIIS